MTTYELPPESTAPCVWVSFRTEGASDTAPPPGEYRRRVLPNGRVIWVAPDGIWHTWVQLLTLGIVHDTHPDLGDVPPLPWQWVDGDIVDADGVPVSMHYPEVGELIVRAVNAYYAEKYFSDSE